MSVVDLARSLRSPRSTGDAGAIRRRRAPAAASTPRTPRRRARAGRGLLIAGALLVAAVVLVAVFAPALAPYEPGELSEQGSLVEPSGEHLLGTDDIGRDLLSLLIYGTRTSVVVAFGAAVLSTALGAAVGLAAGTGSRGLDSVLMRLVDVALAFPRLPLLVLVAALAGADRVVLILVIGLVSWPELARVVRSQVLSERERGFVAAARGFGGGRMHMVRRHIGPAVAPLVVVGFVSIAGQAVLMEAGLAFLGLSDPIAISWGLVLNRALVLPGLYFTSVWVWWVLPIGAAITVTVLGFTFLGVGIEPALNPRAQQN